MTRDQVGFALSHYIAFIPEAQWWNSTHEFEVGLTAVVRIRLSNLRLGWDKTIYESVIQIRNLSPCPSKSPIRWKFSPIFSSTQMALAETRVASPLLSRYTGSSARSSDIRIHVVSTEITAVYLSNIRIASYSKTNSKHHLHLSLFVLWYSLLSSPVHNLKENNQCVYWGLGVKANRKHPKKSPSDSAPLPFPRQIGLPPRTSF